MVGQILVINKLLKEENKGQHVTHVVVMGTGEPFDNYDNVLDFIRIINHPKGLAIGARHITVSTCGIVVMRCGFEAHAHAAHVISAGAVTRPQYSAPAVVVGETAVCDA